jgi:hypothetical protein
VLLENYQSDSLVGVDEDSDQEVSGDVVSYPRRVVPQRLGARRE